MTSQQSESSLRHRRIRVGACLSFSDRYAQFGEQAANALEAWRSLDGAADLILEDDMSDPDTLREVMPGVASRCDVLLGPYSTQLMRAAGHMAEASNWLVWNHGGSGDDVEAAHPGHVVSVLTPTSRYAEPFLRRLASEDPHTKLWIVQGKGSFGRQVTAGAESSARSLGLDAIRISAGELPSTAPSTGWNLFSAGTFEDDVQVARSALTLPYPPRWMCAVAAGVGAFADAVESADGVFGVGQWVRDKPKLAQLGPTESDFVATYFRLTASTPDYPAVQAVAAAVLAAHCAREAGGTARDVLWAEASELDTSTLFGSFKVDPATGVQIKHEAVLMRWDEGRLVAA